jgi:hypothetical protein
MNKKYYRKLIFVLLILNVVFCFLPHKSIASQKIDEDLYYINNTQSGKYLSRNGSTPVAKQGKISAISAATSWYIEMIDTNYCTIRVNESTNFYLSNDSDNTVITISKSTPDDSCKWLVKLTSSGLTFQNKKTEKYLHINSSSIKAYSTLTSYGYWRIIAKTKYGNNSTYMYRELTNITINSMAIIQKKSGSISMVKTPSSSKILWSNAKDFTYTSSDASIATVSDSGIITAKKIGKSIIKVTHKVTGVSTKFELYVVCDASFIGLNSMDSHDHYSALSTAKSNWENNKSDVVIQYNYSTKYTEDFILTNLKYSKLFVYRGHGGFYNNISCILIELDENNSKYFGANKLYDFYTSEVKNKLPQAKIVSFIACSTAENDSDGVDRSIAYAAYKAGANATVGFEDTIDCKYANKWTITYIENLSNGKSVSDACYNALHNGSYVFNCANNLNDYQIFGNKTQTLQ